MAPPTSITPSAGWRSSSLRPCALALACTRALEIPLGSGAWRGAREHAIAPQAAQHACGGAAMRQCGTHPTCAGANSHGAEHAAGPRLERHPPPGPGGAPLPATRHQLQAGGVEEGQQAGLVLHEGARALVDPRSCLASVLSAWRIARGWVLTSRHQPTNQNKTHRSWRARARAARSSARTTPWSSSSGPSTILLGGRARQRPRRTRACTGAVRHPAVPAR